MWLFSERWEWSENSNGIMATAKWGKLLPPIIFNELDQWLLSCVCGQSVVMKKWQWKRSCMVLLIDHLSVWSCFYNRYSHQADNILALPSLVTLSVSVWRKYVHVWLQTHGTNTSSEEQRESVHDSLLLRECQGRRDRCSRFFKFSRKRKEYEIRIKVGES